MSDSQNVNVTIVCAESAWFAQDDPAKPLPPYEVGIPASYVAPSA